MKKRTFNPGVLTVDVCVFMFVEWLNRRGLYSRFAANLSAFWNNSKSPRATIRDVIANLMVSEDLSLVNAISSSFAFRSTPEGPVFWLKASLSWKSYLESFSFVI